MKIQNLVEEFHRKFDLTVNNRPSWPSDDDAQLRSKLIEEEFEELKAALSEKNIVEVADALGDLVYVIYGAAATFGIDLDLIVDEIHRSNMSKVWPDGSVQKNEYGKVVKPSSYSPAELPPILDRMTQRAIEKEKKEALRQEELKNCEHLYVLEDKFGRLQCAVCGKILDCEILSDVQEEIAGIQKKLSEELEKERPRRRKLSSLATSSFLKHKEAAALCLSQNKIPQATDFIIQAAEIVSKFTVGPPASEKLIETALVRFMSRLDDSESESIEKIKAALKTLVGETTVTA